MVALSEGERVPADAILRQGDGVEIDESLLTGESVPVAKRCAIATVAMGAPGGDETPFLFSGTLIVRGQGLGEIARPGRDPSWAGSGAASGPLWISPGN